MERRTCFYNAVIFILIICFTQFYTTEGKTPSGDEIHKKKTMLDKISVCPDVKFIYNSSFSVECDKVPQSIDAKEDNDYALCTLLYDIMNKICEYNSKILVTENHKIKIPENEKEFDNNLTSLQKTFKNYQEFKAGFCDQVPSMFDNFNRVGISSAPETIPYITYVKEKLLSSEQCPYTCHNTDTMVKPFCMILLWANKLFLSIKPIKIPNQMDGHTLEDLVSPDNIPSKEQLTEGTKKNLPKEQLIGNKNNDVTITNKEPTKQLINQHTDNSKKSDNVKIDSQDPSNVQVEQAKDKKPEISEVKEQGKDNANLPLSPKNDKTDAVAPRPIENIPGNSNVIQEEVNADNELVSGEDHQNKKENENDIDENNEHDNADNDFKESINNSEDGAFLAENSVDQHNLPQEKKKVFPHSSTLKEEDESHFFTYFSIISLLCVGLYVGYHNKQKILAMFLEGRRSRRSRGSRRRPSTASYRKLDCNLEEAVTSQCNANVTHVIY